MNAKQAIAVLAFIGLLLASWATFGAEEVECTPEAVITEYMTTGGNEGVGIMTRIEGEQVVIFAQLYNDLPPPSEYAMDLVIIYDEPTRRGVFVAAFDKGCYQFGTEAAPRIFNDFMVKIGNDARKEAAPRVLMVIPNAADAETPADGEI